MIGICYPRHLVQASLLVALGSFFAPALAAPAADARADVAQRMLSAFESRDVAALVATSAATAMIAMPFAQEGPTQLQGKEQIAGYFTAVFQRYQGIRFAKHVLTMAADGKTVFIETQADFDATDGSRHGVGYVWALVVQNGLITSSRAYSMAAPLVGGPK